MSLTGFNRLRRMKQVEEMKPENIVNVQEEIKTEEAVEEAPVNEEKIIEEVNSEVPSENITSAPRRRNTRRTN